MILHSISVKKGGLDCRQQFPVKRISLSIHGEVQGVGFRPFVYSLAHSYQLSGWIRNDGAGVSIEAQGEALQIQKFINALQNQLPPLARITSLQQRELSPRRDSYKFVIADSEHSAVSTGITADAAVCDACLREMFNPADRRYRYPFINCTHCGPRYTITSALPYDRPNTSMAKFTLCAACKREYTASDDRRFHAQPNACSQCGPQLSLFDSKKNAVEAEDPLEQVVRYITDGKIVAIKSLGGFHLVCDARNAAAVSMLRTRKQREEKPFAVMALNPDSVSTLADINALEKQLLMSHQRPVVLLRKRSGCDEMLPGTAPGLAWLGVMLPYTPLHYLLFHEVAGRPEGSEWLSRQHELLLVMTSANPGGEPLVMGNTEALLRLNSIADYVLLHDRDIRVRCDDSVMRVQENKPNFIRRARGFTPQAIQMPVTGKSVLACGAWFKNTVCVTREDNAYLSQHIGDLDNAATCEAMQSTVAHLLDVLEITPDIVAHDLHPEFFSTQFAVEFAQQHGLPVIGVQHHHAHIAAVMAEHHVEEPVLGLALDGVGLGNDGTAWGGELLRVNGAQFAREGHLFTLPMPGGDRAAREPWRMAAAVLHAMGRIDDITRRFTHAGAAIVTQMLQQQTLLQKFNCPHTSSAGRWFDAAAGILGVKEVMRYEGQAAMLLEGMAEQYGPVAPLQDGFIIDENNTLSLLPLMAVLLDCKNTAYGAALFHATLAHALGVWLQDVSEKTSVRTIVLSGGCFLNHVLSRLLRAKLVDAELRVFSASQVPCNDGGISLGQAWIAMQASRDVTGV